MEYFADGKYPLKRNQPLIWLNDGTGRFSTLKVSDFVGANNDPFNLGNGHLAATRNGYSPNF